VDGFFVLGNPAETRKVGLAHMAQETGTVKWFDGDKGYGFIRPDDGGEDLFVHHTGIVGSGFKSLEEGDKVSYEVAQGRKGMQAQGVTKVAGGEPEIGRDLAVPAEVGAAARVLVEHFAPDELYRAMIAARP